MMKALYVLLTILMLQNASAMKIDSEEEHHSGALITLENKDFNPELLSMQSNYNRLGAAILKGGSAQQMGYIHIKNIIEDRIGFIRALMLKAYEIAKDREAPISLSFFNTTGDNHETLAAEWQKYQLEIDKFYENP